MYHYVYRITNKKLNKHYYGVRTSKRLPKEDIGIYYFSSSSDKDFVQDQKNNPKDYKYKVVKTFTSRSLAVEFEIFLHNKFKVSVNETFYNKAIQSSVGFDLTGTKVSESTRKKMSLSAISRERQPHTEETKKKIGENWKGRSHSKESKIKISNSHKGKIISEEHRMKIGEAHKGMIRSKETKDKMRESHKKRKELGLKLPTSICPHCNKEGSTSNMKRWHFDNCKFK